MTNLLLQDIYICAELCRHSVAEFGYAVTNAILGYSLIIMNSLLGMGGMEGMGGMGGGMGGMDIQKM